MVVVELGFLELAREVMATGARTTGLFIDGVEKRTVGVKGQREVERSNHSCI